MPRVLSTDPHVKGANSESRQQLEECGKILEKVKEQLVCKPRWSASYSYLSSCLSSATVEGTLGGLSPGPRLPAAMIPGSGSTTIPLIIHS